jgi:hypothetical protein
LYLQQHLRRYITPALVFKTTLHNNPHLQALLLKEPALHDEGNTGSFYDIGSGA